MTTSGYLYPVPAFFLLLTCWCLGIRCEEGRVPTICVCAFAGVIGELQPQPQLHCHSYWL